MESVNPLKVQMLEKVQSCSKTVATNHYVATEHLKCGYCDWGTDFFVFYKFN